MPNSGTMNKTNKGIEVNLSVVAVSAILVASLFVMSSSRFMPDAMAQGVANQTGAAIGGAANQTGAALGGAANQTGAAAGGAANQTGAAAGGAANQTGAAAGGAANQTGMMMNETGGAANQTGMMMNETGGAANQTAMVMIPQSSMMTMLDNVQTAMSAVGDDESAMMALQSVDQELRSAATAAGMSVPTTSETGGDTDTDTGGDTSDDGGDTSDDGGDTSDDK
jgi:hypothetical protein